MSQALKGTFASAQSVNLGQLSPQLVIPFGTVTAKLTLAGAIDASNTAKTQKSIDNGQTWADQVTYNAAQSNVAVTVVAGEQWRLAIVAQQAFKAMDYALLAES